MATILGHMVVAAAAANTVAKKSKRSQYYKILLLSLLLAVIPDFDVISFKFDIPYSAEWGHRGASHSLIFSVLISLLFTLASFLFIDIKKLKSLVTVFSIYFISIFSHPLLDMLTNGGLGCAVFWPFDHTRYFFPVTPIPVSPIGIAPSLIYVIAWEFFLIFPVAAISYTLRGKLASKAKLIFTLFYICVLITAYWFRLK